MPTEKELINARKEKRSQLMHDGNPYPARVNPSNSINKIKMCDCNKNISSKFLGLKNVKII